MAAKKTPPTAERSSLREDIHRGMAILPNGVARVDREAGVIRGVKVIGLKSDNAREYLPEAVRKALPMYEGRSVRINHPKRGEETRDTEDVFGWLKDVKPDASGELYGDLHFLKTHPMAARVCEAAERNPALFGLSHNAVGDGDTRKDGVFVVREIVQVHSVDLVADPATTNGLFEHKGNRPIAKIKVKAALTEKVLPKLTDAKRADALKKILEAMSGDMEMDGGGEDHRDHLYAAHKACQESGDDETADKILGLLKTPKTEKKTEESEEDDEDDEKKPKVKEGEEEDEDKDDKKKTEESRKTAKRLRELEAKDSCRDLCEAAKVVPTKTLLKALVALTDDADRKALIEEHKGKAGKPGGPRSGSTSGSGTSLTEGQIPETIEGRMAFLLV